MDFLSQKCAKAALDCGCIFTLRAQATLAVIPVA